MVVISSMKKKPQPHAAPISLLISMSDPKRKYKLQFLFCREVSCICSLPRLVCQYCNSYRDLCNHTESLLCYIVNKATWSRNFIKSGEETIECYSLYILFDLNFFVFRDYNASISGISQPKWSRNTNEWPKDPSIRITGPYARFMQQKLFQCSNSPLRVAWYWSTTSLAMAQVRVLLRVSCSTKSCQRISSAGVVRAVEASVGRTEVPSETWMPSSLLLYQRRKN